MKRILGIDYGEVRVGLAITDGLGITAQGMDTLVINGDNNLFISSISNIIKEYDVAEVVIGYPKNMNGTLSKKTEEIDNLIPKIANLGVIVHKVDERLTTVSSYRTMRELGISQKKKNKIADKLSAIYILEGFLNRTDYLK
ncbi:MAG: Holliday junction resolvase RuvX [Clostridia bacterium]|nr:Holliday junction resolvase RuvX [Clostridia bacterium]MDD4386434.1 Holliday junction resolvase RuvX [Clostridia bacterium]